MSALEIREGKEMKIFVNSDGPIEFHITNEEGEDATAIDNISTYLSERTVSEYQAAAIIRNDSGLYFLQRKGWLKRDEPSDRKGWRRVSKGEIMEINVDVGTGRFNSVSRVMENQETETAQTPVNMVKLIWEIKKKLKARRNDPSIKIADADYVQLFKYSGQNNSYKTMNSIDTIIPLSIIHSHGSPGSTIVSTGAGYRIIRRRG